MKVSITGASHFVNRMFEACGSYQWAREFLKNSLEAGATRIEFGIEWQAVEKHGVYRRTIVDDGTGMDRDDLRNFFSTLGAGAKKIGGIHDNFGVGAKVASLPWNPDGVVVISYKNGQASMIWIVLEPEAGEYELVEFQTEKGTACVVDPSGADIDGLDWGAIRPDWVKQNGTIVVLLGSEEHPDTVLGNPSAEEKDIKGLSVYLNTRFWDLGSADVKVTELRNEKKTLWPQGPNDRDDARRPNNRRVLGAKHWLTDVKAPNGKLQESGTVPLESERVKLHWYLWQGERPAIHSYAKKGGYIAVRYGDELFHLTSDKVRFRWFGIIESKVQQNVTLILEPQHYRTNDAFWGIHPDQSRNRLIFTGNGEKGVDIPLSDWGVEFVEKMPAPIYDAIRAARGEMAGSIESEEYRKRLQDKFGNRWSVKVLVEATKKDKDPVPVTVTDETVEVFIDPDPYKEHGRRKRRKTLKIVRKKVTPNGSAEGVERESPVDVPKYRFVGKDEFQRPWHLASWIPNDPSGPTVLINLDSPILREVVQYHQNQYPDMFAEEVAETIHHVFGEVATCKVAHSQKLVREITEDELDRDYRSETALTLGLMGLLAEEAVIAQRLGKLGRKKPTTV